MLVDDVHAFEGHIACDPAARSEIVLPVWNAEGALVAVMDVDSTEPAAFDQEDRIGLERVVSLLTPTWTDSLPPDAPSRRAARPSVALFGKRAASSLSFS